MVARTMALTWAGGATLLMASLAAFPPPAGSNVTAFIVISAIGYAGALVMLIAGDIPDRAFQGVIALASALISGLVAAGGEGVSAYAFFYPWIMVYAFHVLPAREAAGQIAFAALFFVFAMFANPAPVSGVAIVMPLGAIFATGGFAYLLRRRLDHLVGHLSTLALSDPLTSLPNRRAFDELFEKELSRSRRSGVDLSVISIDLDFFKAINDSEGHSAGDMALVATARALEGCCRDSDTVARIGGEEFCLLLPATDVPSAQRVATRVQASIASVRPGLTASMGIAAYPDDGTTPDELMCSADQALYYAKATGRNRVVAMRGTPASVGGDEPAATVGVR